MRIQNNCNVAIIGGGPRGLAALENLCLVYADSSSDTHSGLDPDDLQIWLFDNSSEIGSGTPWKTDQTPHNWFNISERALEELAARPSIHWGEMSIAKFPSYIDWCHQQDIVTYTKEQDIFPPRSRMGYYLKARFESLATPLIANGLLRIIHQEVIQLKVKDRCLELIIADGRVATLFHESVLTIGHQPTAESEQLKKWTVHSENTEAILLKDCYASDLEQKVGTAIAIRGMGLAMIDVVRLLAHSNESYFTKTASSSPFLQYHFRPGSFKRIIVFSLDGFPPAPKPIGATVDQKFTPNQQQRQDFIAYIQKQLEQAASIDSTEFLLEAFAVVALPIYLRLSKEVLFPIADEAIVKELIKTHMAERFFDHPAFIDRKLAKIEYLKSLSLMACGRTAFSLDYILGQVWRHLQPDMYRLFAHTELPDRVISEIVALDESTKPYSYGPPVESVLQLIAMMEAKVLLMDVAADPDIKEIDQGWLLSHNQNSYVADTMIDSVLDGPKILEVTSPIVTNLLEDDLIKAMSDKLGVATRKDGIVESRADQSPVSIGILGRNSKGSVLGVDAILECFSPEVKAWAHGVYQRHLKL